MNSSWMRIIMLLTTMTLPQEKPHQAFEIDAVRLNKSGETNSAIVPHRGVFRATNTTLMQLMRFAFQIQEFQVSKQPAWFNSERYDIEAKAPADIDAENAEVWRPLLEELLARRFKLSYHIERKEQAGYELVVSRRGHKLKQAMLTNCIFPTPGECGFRASLREIVGDQVSMDAFATRLSRSTGQPVVNKTNLEGIFDLVLHWTAEVRPGPAIDTAPREGLSIFAALEEQLGLQLEGAKTPTRVFVIDHVERPSEN